MKPFTIFSVLVFSIVSVLHMLRLVFGWEVSVEGWVVPMWISVPGFAVAALLAFMLWRESHR